MKRFIGLMLFLVGYSSISLGGQSCPSQVNTSLQLHRVLANRACSGKTVILSQGKFLPILPANGDPRDRTFKVTVRNLTLIGHGTRKTILSGDIGVRRVNTDNTRHVMTVLSTGNGLTLKNLTVSDGYSDLVNNDDGTSAIGQGAGIYIKNANVSMNHVLIKNNTLFNTSPPLQSANMLAGGAGFFAQGGHILITNSSIINNQAIAGGGFTAVGKVSTTTVFQIPPSSVLENQAKNGSLIIKNTLIKNNKAINDNGGGAALGLDDFEIINSKISNNIVPGGVGGGITGLNNIHTTVNKSSFIGNQATTYGGAVFELVNVPINNVTQIDSFETTISNSYFANNNSPSTTEIQAFGAGLTIEQYFGNANVYQVKVVNSNFNNNTTDGVAGGMYVQDAATSFQNDNFINNTANSGGGLAVAFSSVVPMMHKVTFINNFAPNSAIFGPADAAALDVVANSQVQSMNKVLFLNNSTQASGGAIKLAYDDPTMPPSSIGIVKNTAFMDNSAAISGNAIFCDKNQMIGPFVNTLFGNNQTIVGCIVNP